MGLVLGAMLALTVAIPALADGDVSAHVRLQVTGTSEMTVEPDYAIVQSAVEGKGATPQEAQAAGEAIYEHVRAALAAFDVNVVAGHYGLHPRYEYREESRQSEVVGYVASRSFEVSVQEISQVAEILQALLGAGVESVYGVRYGASRSDELRSQAIAQAIADARQQAEAVALATGGSIERIAEITLGSNGEPPVLYAMRAEKSAGFEPSPVSVQASANVVFVLRVE